MGLSLARTRVIRSYHVVTREVTLVGHFGWWAGFLRGRLFNIFLSTHTYDNTPMHTRTYILRAHDINGYERLDPFHCIEHSRCRTSWARKTSCKTYQSTSPTAANPSEFFLL